MRITNIEINNFRGIRKSMISFPLDSRIICLIGAGDSTKTTILKAIEWAFWPTWNLVVADTDFYDGDTITPIIIRATFSEFPDLFLSEDKYGLFLRRPNALFGEDIDDEPQDNLPLCLTIQLTIDATLEPKWEIVCNRMEPKLISHNDRKQLYVGSIGANVSKDLVWGKNSVLQKYADAKGVLHDAYTDSLRNAAKNADLSALDSVSVTLSSVGKKYGVYFEDQIKSRLLIQNNSFSSTVGLFDGDAPLSQLGTGSQRLLSMGLNIGISSCNALLLIDEVENGLEPYRLRNLINEFRDSRSSAGQILMTTHSPVTVAECVIDEIMVIHSINGTTNAFVLKSDQIGVNDTIQAQVRRNPESFLSKRLVVCEGSTEIGFIRAFDRFLAKTKNYRMAYKGVNIADGNGANIFKCADIFRECGYDICIVMDSDNDNDKSEKAKMREAGVKVFDWDEHNALEEQFFMELPMNAIQCSIDLATSYKGIDSIASKLTEGNIPFEKAEGHLIISSLVSEQRKSLGRIAKENAWYKRIGLGEQLSSILFNNYNALCNTSTIKRIVDGLSEWVMKDEEART
ncbi:MAG: AAA family ATPase [Clostridia bacterium]|nr:AAA family ATPase [Clostridia bacterium]